MADNFDLKKFLKESKVLENRYYKDAEADDAEHIDALKKDMKDDKKSSMKEKIREYILSELELDIDDSDKADATLNADDRDILNMDAGAFYDRHLKGSIGKKHQPTVFVSHSGDKKVALVLEAAALTTKGNLELVCRKIKQNQNGNQSDDLASEKQHLGISFDLAAVSKGYTSYKNPLWSGGQPSIACGIQEGVSVIEAHNKLADCLTAAAKKSN